MDWRCTKTTFPRHTKDSLVDSTFELLLLCVKKTYTNDHIQIEGNQGLKDYELYQHALVKENYDSLLTIPDVRRCLITGFSGQNPYVMEYGHDNPWIEQEAKLERERKRNEYWAKKDAGRHHEGKAGKKNAMENIEEVIMSNEEAEKERLLDVDKEDV